MKEMKEVVFDFKNGSVNLTVDDIVISFGWESPGKIAKKIKESLLYYLKKSGAEYLNHGDHELTGKKIPGSLTCWKPRAKIVTKFYGNAWGRGNDMKTSLNWEDTETPEQEELRFNVKGPECKKCKAQCVADNNVICTDMALAKAIGLAIKNKFQIEK